MSVKTGDIDIEVFRLLDEIRSDYRVLYKTWSDMAGVPQSRISELKGLLRGKERIGRAFNINKMILLLNGLKEIIGKEALKDEFKTRLNELKSIEERILLIIWVLDNEELVQLYNTARAKWI